VSPYQAFVWGVLVGVLAGIAGTLWVGLWILARGGKATPGPSSGGGGKATPGPSSGGPWPAPPPLGPTWWRR
jgi:hypothetical protein